MRQIDFTKFGFKAEREEHTPPSVSHSFYKSLSNKTSKLCALNESVTVAIKAYTFTSPDYGGEWTHNINIRHMPPDGLWVDTGYYGVEADKVDTEKKVEALINKILKAWEALY